MDKGMRISITSGTIVTTLLVLVGAYIFWLLRDLALLVLTAIVIASAIAPGVAFFVRYRIPRFISALLVYVLVFGVLFVVLYLFLPPIVSDAAGFLSAMPRYLDTISVPSSLSTITDATGFGSGGEGTQSFVQALLSL